MKLNYVDVVAQALAGPGIVMLVSSQEERHAPMFDIVARPRPFGAGEFLGLTAVVKAAKQYLSKVRDESTLVTYVFLSPLTDHDDETVGVHVGFLADAADGYRVVGREGGDIETFTLAESKVLG